MSRGWIGVDLDNTLATYHHWKAYDVIGQPIPAMAERVKRWLAEGIEVRIFTARVAPIFYGIHHPMFQQAASALVAINHWTKLHFGKELPVTAVKDMDCIEIWDDRAVTVEANTGLKLSVTTRGTDHEITDSERLDALESLAYRHNGWTLRRSTMDRGMRLHEDQTGLTVRGAIDAYLGVGKPETLEEAA